MIAAPAPIAALASLLAGLAAAATVVATDGGAFDLAFAAAIAAAGTAGLLVHRAIREQVEQPLAQFTAELEGEVSDAPPGSGPWGRARRAHDALLAQWLAAMQQAAPAPVGAGRRAPLLPASLGLGAGFGALAIVAFEGPTGEPLALALVMAAVGWMAAGATRRAVWIITTSLGAAALAGLDLFPLGALAVLGAAAVLGLGAGAALAGERGLTSPIAFAAGAAGALALGPALGAGFAALSVLATLRDDEPPAERLGIEPRAIGVAGAVGLALGAGGTMGPIWIAIGLAFGAVTCSVARQYLPPAPAAAALAGAGAAFALAVPAMAGPALLLAGGAAAMAVPLDRVTPAAGLAMGGLAFLFVPLIAVPAIAPLYAAPALLGLAFAVLDRQTP